MIKKHPHRAKPRMYLPWSHPLPCSGLVQRLHRHHVMNYHVISTKNVPLFVWDISRIHVSQRFHIRWKALRTRFVTHESILLWKLRESLSSQQRTTEQMTYQVSKYHKCVIENRHATDASLFRVSELPPLFLISSSQCDVNLLGLTELGNTPISLVHHGRLQGTLLWFT